MIRQQVRAAIGLLDWLRARSLTLEACRQADLDEWLATDSPGNRSQAGHFVRWAATHRINPALRIAAVRWTGPAGPLDQEQRWQNARRLLHDDSLDTAIRVAGLLVLLYAQMPSAISRLTLDDIDTSDERLVRVRLGPTPVTAPEPLAALIWDLAANRHGQAVLGDTGTSRWLFPGGQAGRPVGPSSLAGRLQKIGIHPAREAVGLRRELVAANRDAYLLDLAASLDTYAARLGEAGRRAEAITVSQEAVDTYRELAAVNRSVYLPGLAAAVNNHAGWLAGVGRLAEAVLTSEEAVGLRRELVAVNRDAYLANLGVSLNNHAVMLADAGRQAEAVLVAQEAFELRRELAAVNRDAYLPDYLQSVAVLGYVLVECARFGEAIAPLVEALAIFQVLPDHAQDIASMVVDLLRRAYAGDAPSVTGRFRQITGQNIPAWMTEPPAAHN